MNKSRSVVALAAAVIVAIIALVWWSSRTPVPFATPGSAVATTTDTSATTGATATPKPGLAAPPAQPNVPGMEPPIMPTGAPPIDLPPDIEPLAEEFIPGTTEWEEVPLVEDSPLTIRFLPAKYNVVAPAPIVLYLEVVDQSTKKRVAVDRASARVRTFDNATAWVDVPMIDDGSHRYIGTLANPPRSLLGRVVAEGVVETKIGGTRRIPQALIYTTGPRANLTGRWRDAKTDGHLALAAEIEVETAGTFTLIAQLVGPNREPIALLRSPLTPLDAGTHWFPLRAWGKALRDARVDGPYEVRNVLLTRDYADRGDYDPGPTVISAHRTAAYRAAEFSDAAYVEPPVARAPLDQSTGSAIHTEGERPTRAQ